MVTITPHTTRATGTILTAAIYNGDHQNHITNANSLASVVNAIPVISSYGADLIDSADASAALTTLSVSTFAKTLLDDTDANAARTTLGVGWETVYDADITSQTSVPITNLSAYRNLRIHVYAYSDSVTNTLIFQFSSNNGSSWISAANDYNMFLNYQDEATATVNGFYSGTLTGINSIRTMNIGASVNLGLHWNMEITEFNQPRHKSWMGNLMVYNGSLIMHARTSGRSNTGNTTIAMNAIRATSASAFSGHLFIEGKRG